MHRIPQAPPRIPGIALVLGVAAMITLNIQELSCSALFYIIHLLLTTLATFALIPSLFMSVRVGPFEA